MPVIGDQSSQPGTDIIKIPATGFTYSMTRIADLEASEYTLVHIASDVSGSVSNFKSEMENVLEEIASSCQKSPRADNLLMRHTMFGDKVNTNHDWKMLRYINPADYKNCLNISGSTALFDAAQEGLTVMGDMGEKLTQAKFACNGIIFFITDGCDNASHSTPVMVKDTINNIVVGEKMESLISILIGVGIAPYTKQALDRFKNEAGLTHFIELKDASKNSLAKLAAFVSKSISSQSNALGSGSASRQLTSGNLTI